MLVRSVASESVYSVHTGYMEYDTKYTKIPCAAITVEDSEMFRRMQNRGQNITVHLVIETQFIPNCLSNNLIF
jgi:carboxypeptidase Q